MAKSNSLAQWRDELIQQLESYRSLPEYILDGVGTLLQSIVNHQAVKARATFLPPDASDQENEAFPSYWINGLAIAFFTFLLGWLISWSKGYAYSFEEYKLTLWAAVTGGLALVANKVNIRAFLNTFRESCVDKMLRIADIQDLEQWLRNNFRLWKPLFSGLLIGPLLGVLLYINWLDNLPQNLNQNPSILNLIPQFHLGPFVTIVLSCIQAIWVAYYLYPFYVAFPARLHRFHFDLYALDPSSSEVVGRLSGLLTFILYVTIGYIVWLTFGLTFVNVLTTLTPIPGLVFSVFVWAPAVILYSAGQFHLSALITRAKWITLNEVQTKVEALYNTNKVPDEEMLDRLGKLMDYHDRIKSTPNSGLNFRAIVNLINSLLLPVLALIVANLKTAAEFFNSFFSGH